MQPAPLVGDELLSFIAVGNGQNDALFVRLDAEKIHHALHGRAAPVHDHRHRQLELGAYRAQRVERLGVNY